MNKMAMILIFTDFKTLISTLTNTCNDEIVFFNDTWLNSGYNWLLGMFDFCKNLKKIMTLCFKSEKY